MRQVRSLLLSCYILIMPLWALVAAADNVCIPRTYLERAVPETDARHESIRMDSGEVTIRLGPELYSVDAVFEFFNTGEATTHRIGLPTLDSGVQEKGRSVCPAPLEFHASLLALPAPLCPIVGLLGLETWVDGRRTNLSEDRDFSNGEGSFSKAQGSPHYTPQRRWMIGDVAFPGHAKTTIRYRYKGWYMPDRSVRFGYGAARSWKGNVGKLTFIIDCADVGGTKNVDITEGFAEDSRKELQTENLIILEERDLEPTRAAHLRLYAYRYDHELADEMGRSQRPDPGIEFPSGPPRGQAAEMWSQANYDPKLADPFFESNEWSYPWYIIKHPDGTFEDTTSDRRPEKEPTRLKQTAKCFSTSSGSEHLVKFCEARLLDANMIDLLIHHESPAFNDTLKVWIRNGVFTCQYWTAQKELISTGMGPGTIWKTTRQELTLDKKVYRKGDVIKGKIDFERVQEPTNPKYIETWGREPTTIKVNGVFKTIVE